MLLKTEDVDIYYEVYGQGQPLLLIHGVLVDSEMYLEAAKLLAKHYQVITYDRRGLSRSTCKTASAFSMSDQVEDIRALLDALKIESAYIFGASGGAVIGAAFLMTYPERVKHLIMFEPAIMSFIRELNNEFDQWISDMYAIIDRGRFTNALLQFDKSVGFHDPRAKDRSEDYSARTFGNLKFSMLNEFPGLIDYVLDVEELKKQEGKITIAVGERNDGSPYSFGGISLGERLGIGNVFYPGGHNMPYDIPMEFAIALCGTFLMTGVQ